jgi:murein DD-endopeptidase MepM/ murein hydrolase activator NlpD
MNSASSPKAKSPISKKLRLVYSLSMLLILIACNYPGRSENLIAGTATMAAARQTAAAILYPSPGPGGTPVAPQPTTVIPGGSTSEAPTYVVPTALPIITSTPFSPYTGQIPAGMTLYYSQSGETLESIAGHFRTSIARLQNPTQANTDGFLASGIPLFVPDEQFHAPYGQFGLADNLVIYGRNAQSVDVSGISSRAGGYLNHYAEYLFEGRFTGPEIVATVAVETSIDPRLLLAVLEYQSGWVYAWPEGAEEDKSPLNYEAVGVEGLYEELQVAARELARGYYGWREGSLQTLRFEDESQAAIHPELNAGSVAIQYLFAGFYTPSHFFPNLYGEGGFLALYQQMFGDPSQLALEGGEVIPAGLAQPTLTLPFQPGLTWALTSGPHITWQVGSPRGAIDLAPRDDLPGCTVSNVYATASAPGLVVRSSRGAVAVDLDGDGNEGTGWVIIYMHLAREGRIADGSWVNTDDPLGYPSCEGGFSSGTHLHITRKYNGEWIGASGAVPFVMDGWLSVAGQGAYAGTLVRDGQTVYVGTSDKEYTWIRRDE